MTQGMAQGERCKGVAFANWTGKELAAHEMMGVDKVLGSQK